jgi:altronate dehydratase
VIVRLGEITRLPATGDNAAIVTRRLDAGTRVSIGGSIVTLDWTVLEGHRVAVEPIAAGQPLLSWGLPFGYALRDIAPGEYLRNARTLDALRLREVGFPLPEAANFRDTDLAPFALDEATFRPGVQVAPAPGDVTLTFMGYDRGVARGVGTRNHVVILATSSRTGGWARALEARLDGVAASVPGIDGIVSVTHTEGGGGTPNNRELLLRTLAGMIVHPNVGAVLVVDRGDEAVTGAMVRAFLREHDYPLDDVLHRFVTLRDGFEADLARGEALIRDWLPSVGGAARTEQPLSALKLGLQCGGSDAFSGVSGNPLAAWAAREVVRHGGAANLAETDELIGAEAYVLRNVRDLATARRFLDVVERFKERAAWHGHTAEGNPSGGNLYRGLANIALKSLGAATKRDPAVRLDHVIEYGERMLAPGYSFMDSPGNDLESIAGQVASGSNLLYFVTGNGSITNFPFVPTIKIVTTTGRYDLLRDEMDVNAGAYLDGTPMDELGEELLARTLAVAGGERSVGELAGHSQVSIWRDWPRTGPEGLAEDQAAPLPDGRPLLTAADIHLDAAEQALAGRTFRAVAGDSGPVTDRVGLVLPTSLCAGQIARRIAGWLDRERGGQAGVSRYVALPHTEGCGASSGSSEEIFVRTLVGHLTHPLVGPALLLEHGCEKTHNDYLRHALRERDIDPARFGWASIQLDGGIDAVERKVAGWFATALNGVSPVAFEDTGLGALRLGVAAVGDISQEVGRSVAGLTRLVVAAGGTVVTPEAAVPPGLGVEETPSLAYAAQATPGLHVMETPTADWGEILTGLGATGVEIIVACVSGQALAAHRMIPFVQVAEARMAEAGALEDFDLLLSGASGSWLAELLDLVLRVASRQVRPRMMERGNIEFQITRGRLGISM